ncbi:MAG: hypothetical protein HZA78_02330 [Candidatus Schekmanbacteria bacterium]|nr:hypothetical protein [Candidatus Schekmanbacteria bacterium]
MRTSRAQRTASIIWSLPSSKTQTTPSSNETRQFFQVTHPFHPLCGQRLELTSQCYRSGRKFLYYYDPDHWLKGIPAAWTDFGEPDSFLLVSKGRALFRPQDLLELSQILKGLSP